MGIDSDRDSNNNSITQKKMPRSEILRKVLSLFFLAVFLVCGALLFFDWYDGYLIDKQNETIKDLLGTSSTVSSVPEKSEILAKFTALYEQNNDLVGWIKIDDTPIDFAVVQTDNNDDYLRTDFDGNANRNGTIFVDWHCSINPQGHVTVIYGHNMKRESAMFTSLRNYKKLSYYKEHPVIEFDTIYEENKYLIFGVVLMDASPENPENEFQLYAGFRDDVSYDEYIASIRSHSYLDIPVEANSSDNIIALVTCSYDFDDARYVVFARQLREGEDAYASVDAATVNDDMIYPAAAE